MMLIIRLFNIFDARIASGRYINNIGQAHGNLILIEKARSECSGESVHLHRLARSFAA